ncbi:MAG: RICIN domain-containing protein [Chloroflexota bacterium]|nr:RICIN domain-containing protein [Chloroflexota bacterium]
MNSENGRDFCFIRALVAYVFVLLLLKPLIDVQKCLEKANKADEMLQRMISFWNDNANNTWATIGPRRLEFGENQRGRLLGTGGRIFISPVPMPEDEVTVRVHKRGGKGKASVTVCKVDSDGRARELRDTIFEPGDDNIGESQSKTLRGVRGHLLQIHLDGKSVTRAFEYSLQVGTLPQSGVYTLQQKSSDRFLDAHQTSDKDFSVVTRSAQNNDTQRWLIEPV